MADTARVTDDSIKVRQLSHYQFSFRAGDAGTKGTWYLQLVLDQGAWEEVLTLTADDADNLQDVLTATDTVYYDIERRLFMFGVTKPGH
ncbi:hypothetical protein [Cellulomonas shaoxiangyii]|uniref:Uncharacterized protein n=1 Tax=Cellulomonas shaoxiangyii TaxID=2566013 RepID=A0A4P7SL76_9CELL|nr:hypothetical protein [Cellulomonas shaoxiangyii]QCB93534.1 hypothetical protein E5225_08125 [Cellulomonas shaoxiangyii]TGY86856.1 hypothetical protein E5226_00445 [Cellulomonas shaoxiangyii]